MIRQLLDSVLLRLIVVIAGLIVMMWVFNIQPIHPDRTLHYCLGVAIPDEISAAQSESFCYCVKNVAKDNDEQKIQACLKEQYSMQQHAQKVRQNLTNQEVK